MFPLSRIFVIDLWDCNILAQDRHKPEEKHFSTNTSHFGFCNVSKLFTLFSSIKMHSAKDHKYELEQTLKVLQTYHNFLIQWFFFKQAHCFMVLWDSPHSHFEDPWHGAVQELNQTWQCNTQPPQRTTIKLPLVQVSYLEVLWTSW